jgi:hypothetical protein
MLRGLLALLLVMPIVVWVQVSQMSEVHQRRARHELFLSQDVVNVVVPRHNEAPIRQFQFSKDSKDVERRSTLAVTTTTTTSNRMRRCS